MSNVSFAQIPGQLMNCMMQTENYVNSIDIINHSQMELMRYYVSVLNGCAYCVDMHFKEAIAAGETEQRLYSVSYWMATDYYSETEQAMLAWTESVTSMATSNELRDDAFEQLEKFFSVDDIANLTLAIVQINAWTRLARSFGFKPGSYQVGQH